MTAPLSQDLRERIVRAVADGSSIRQAAERFQVSASAAIKLMQRVRQTGSTAPAQIGGYRRPLLEPYADWLRALVSDRKGITLREIQAALAARGVVVKALSTVAEMLHRLTRRSGPWGRASCTCHPTARTSTRSRSSCRGTAEGEVPLTPRLGHEALRALAVWVARQHEPEAEKHAVAGAAARPAPASGGSDREPGPTASGRRAGGGP